MLRSIHLPTITSLTLLFHFSFLFLLFIVFLGLTACQSHEEQKKIGIILPLQHKAMDDIVTGFKETLKAEYPKQLEFKIANAQNDMNLQRAIIQQMKDEKLDIIVPVGTIATQMALSLIHDQPIIGIAATYTEKDRQANQTCNVTAVQDEIPPEQVIGFIHSTYPKLTHLALIHSTSDKVFPDVEKAVAFGKQLGIEVKPMMVQTLAELYSVSHALPSNTQGILILKDHLIVSGITTLSMRATKLNIPLITSDQGSVQEGGGFSLGVPERQIGVEGAKLAKAILTGQSVCKLPIIKMTKLTIFMNRSALKKQNQSVAQIEKSAAQYHYAVQVVE